jgi:hypothetical protein
VQRADAECYWPSGWSLQQCSLRAGQGCETDVQRMLHGIQAQRGKEEGEKCSVHRQRERGAHWGRMQLFCSYSCCSSVSHTRMTGPHRRSARPAGRRRWTTTSPTRCALGKNAAGLIVVGLIVLELIMQYRLHVCAKLLL